MLTWACLYALTGLDTCDCSVYNCVIHLELRTLTNSSFASGLSPALQWLLKVCSWDIFIFSNMFVIFTWLSFLAVLSFDFF